MQSIWSTLSLDEMITFKNGRSIKAEAEGRFPVYGSNGVIGHSNTSMYENSIILGRVGAYCGSVARCKSKFWASDNTIVIESKENTDINYLYYLLLDADLNRHAGGSAQPLLTQSRLKPLEFSIPPIKLQQKIASMLSTYDELIVNNSRRIEILEEMARRIYEEWFVHFRFPGHQEVKFKESELGMIPEEWIIAKIADFGLVVTGKTPSKKKPEFFGSDVPFIKTPDMHGNTFCIATAEGLSLEGEKSQAKKTVPENSICVSCIGTAGVVNIVGQESQTNQQINTIIPTDSSHREFLFFALRNLKETINLYGSNGATMVNLNKSKFESLKLIQPSDSWIQKYHNLVEPFFDSIKTLQKKNVNLCKQRDLLLPKLVSGEIDVSDFPMPEQQ